MKTEIFQKNLQHLKSLHPEVYEAVKDPIYIKNYEVTLSKSGVPTLSYIKPNKNKIYLLSKYDPLQEAKTFISSINIDDSINFIVLGLGFGYQVMELIKSVPENSKIIVIETDKILARLAFETNDLSHILTFPGLNIYITNQIKKISSLLENEKIGFSLNGYKIVEQNSLSNINSVFFKDIRKEIEKFFQASVVEIKTQATKSKTFYKNISGNYKNIIASPGITKLKNLMKNIPAIICSAGPSLDKNIQLLKAKRENFILISAATALNPLQKCDIFPDFIVAIDSNEITTQFMNIEKDLKNTWLIYDPVIPPIIPTLFKGKRFIYDSSISLAQWMQKYIRKNGSLGKVFSVAHAGYNLARFMGCSPIIFIGQDLSFCKKRLHSRNTHYYQLREDKINNLNTMEVLDGNKFNNFSKNITQRKGVFNDFLATTIAMDTFAVMFSTAIGDFKNVFNSTEGGLEIKNTENKLLREAITQHCIANINKQHYKILNSISSKPLPKPQIAEPAKKQILIFKEVLQNLNRLENNFLNRAFITKEYKENFILEMNSTIRNLLKNEEATLLLQGYDFLGFSLWNQKSHEILLRKKKGEDKDLLELEFQRDREFFEVLKNSLKFNIIFFKGLVEELDAN